MEICPYMVAGGRLDLIWIRKLIYTLQIIYTIHQCVSNICHINKMLKINLASPPKKMIPSIAPGLKKAQIRTGQHRYAPCLLCRPYLLMRQRPQWANAPMLKNTTSIYTRFTFYHWLTDQRIGGEESGNGKLTDFCFLLIPITKLFQEVECNLLGWQSM